MNREQVPRATDKEKEESDSERTGGERRQWPRCARGDRTGKGRIRSGRAGNGQGC